MATPYISGVSAIIKQRLNETYPHKLEGLSLSRLIKRILLSSASPIIENESPLSPRKQGSGLVNIKGAVSAQAIAYLDEQNVNLNLGNVQNNISLQVNLENISNKKLILKGKYSLLVDEVKNSRFTLQSKIVKQGEMEEISLLPFEKKTLNYNLDISDIDFSEVMKNGYFIDGFLSFTYGTNKPELNLGFTSFKGDFESLKIIEKPIYDSQDYLPTYFSKENEFTHLASSIRANGEDVAVVLGELDEKTGGKRVFDGEHLAISPNDDHNYDNMDFVFTILRSFEKISINIINKQGEVVASHTVSNSVDLLKSYYGGNPRNSKAVNLWKFVPKADMQEGKYHAEINVERYRGSEKFGYDFYIDTTPPKIDSFALDKQRLSLVCSDELAGIKSVIVQKNGKIIKKDAAGSYDIKQDDLKGIMVQVVDFAGNLLIKKLN